MHVDETRTDETRRVPSRVSLANVTPRRDTHAPLKGVPCIVPRSLDGSHSTIPGYRQRFTITLEGDDDSQPVIIRLRQALKLLGRAFKLRCVEAVECRANELPEIEAHGEGVQQPAGGYQMES